MRAKFDPNRALSGFGFAFLLLLLPTLPGLAQTVPLGVESARHIDPISSSARKQSFTYATKDSIPLGLDVYITGERSTTRKKPCILFVFGGAFMAGRRDDSLWSQALPRMVAPEVHSTWVLKRGHLLLPESHSARRSLLARQLPQALPFSATSWLLAAVRQR